MTNEATSKVTDVAENGKAVVATTQRSWFSQLGIEDSSVESLGIEGVEAEKLRNGGLCDADFAKAQRAAAGANTPPAPTGMAR